MQNDNIATLPDDAAARFGGRTALGMHGAGRGEDLGYDALAASARRVAATLVAAGLRPDDRVALLADACPRWGIAFFAALRAGGIALPLDQRTAVAELAAIVNDARPRLMVVGRAQAPLARELLAACDAKFTVLSLEVPGADSPWPSMDGAPAGDGLPCVLRSADAAAVLTYTSGTMGSARGVVTSHGNLRFQMEAIRSAMQNDERSACVSILPLSHLFELTAGFLGVLYGGGSVCYCVSLMPAEVLSAMRERRVTCMVVVPLFLELVRSAIRNEAARQSRLRRRLFTLLVATAAALPLPLRRRLFAPLHRRFGGRLEYFVSGGAPLPPATQRFFSNIGLPVYEGYGLAEASPVVATNRPVSHRAGSVGRPLPGIEVAISKPDGGEILTRGPHVMSGYFGTETGGSSPVDSRGWLHTGDLGYFDRDGFLFVTGRKKNVIVLGSGKKVQPEELETVLFDHPDVAEGCVIGVPTRRGRLAETEEVCAIVVASDAAVERCRQDGEDLELALRRVIEQRALCLSPAKRPSRIILRNEPLPRTSTRKIRRPSLLSWLAQGALQS